MTSSRRILDPLDRTSEVLFGLIMVLTFIASIDAAESGREDVATILNSTIACNFAWGIVDAVMYLMSIYTTRARGLSTLAAIRQAPTSDAAHALLADALGSGLATMLSPPELDVLRRRLTDIPPPEPCGLTRHDLMGAAAVFLIAFLCT